MKLAILVLFAASLSAASFASPNYHKFKHLRVQQGETRLPTQYNIPWICEKREELIARVNKACTDLSPEKFELQLHLPRWFCGKLGDLDIQQQLKWKCGFFPEKRAMMSTMERVSTMEQRDQRVSICNAMFNIRDTIQQDISCSGIAKLTVAAIRAQCPIVSRLSQDFLKERLDRLQQVCRTAAPAKNLVDVQQESGMDYVCKYYQQSGFIAYIGLLCKSRVSTDLDIPPALLKTICEKEKSGNLAQYLNQACFGRSPDTTMAASNQLAETTSIPEHADICTVLERGNEGTTLDLIYRLCDRIEGGGTSLDMDRIMETHWDLCVYDSPEDRLKTICLALKKGYLECPSPNIPGFCDWLMP